jgi:hypothetical protein
MLCKVYSRKDIVKWRVEQTIRPGVIKNEYLLLSFLKGELSEYALRSVEYFEYNMILK